MKFQPPKGTRDLLPEDANKLQKIIETCRFVFEKYGFEPLVTPAFESFELLSAKCGLGEAVKDEIYYFKDKSNRELGLRFDLTMPLARIVSSNPQLPKPFKRYSIDKVWRYDNPQALRWREFWQADIDIVGSNSLISDVECLAAICEVLDKLGFKKYFIRVNNRKFLESILNKFEKEIKREFDQDPRALFGIIDKADRIGIEEVKKTINIPQITDLLSIKGTNNQIIEALREKYGDNEGLKELEEFLDYAKSFGLYERIRIDVSLVRGLEYYTGLVFEINLGAKVSCGGGGRYDNLMKTIGGQDLPATGISLGLDRILEVMKENKMFKIEKIKIKVFVANVNGSVVNDTIKIVQQLREKNINSQMDLSGRNLTKQLEYANNLGIAYVIIVGKKEIESKKFKLRDMNKKIEKELTLEEIIKQLK